MNIAISGASGFIGTYLSAFLMESGHQIFPLGRQMFSGKGNEELVRTLSQCDAVVNLAGAPINKRWTSAYKEELYNSRIPVTGQIVQAMKSLSRKPQLFISTSAVGYYPSTGCHNEDSNMTGEGFLSHLCRKWEQAAMMCPPDVRLVITRFGIVLSRHGGALRPMLLPTQMKATCVIAPGCQPFPWISITDLCRAVLYIIETPQLHGTINMVAPQIVTQREFTQCMGKHYHTWFTLTIPSFIFRLLYGEAASFLTSGQKVVPQRLVEAGFEFTHPDIETFWSL